jgi:hypothetical protein
MLGELETLLKSQNGLNPNGRDAINNLLMTLEYSVRASIITDTINKSEPEMQEIKDWITSEIGKMEDEKRTLEEEKKGLIIANGVVDPKMSALTAKLNELRSIQEEIGDPSKLAERMTRGYKDSNTRRVLIDTMGQYLYSGNLIPRTFKGKVLAPKENNGSSFSGYSLNVEALKELIEVVRDGDLVEKAAEIKEKEELVEGDKTALLKFDPIVKRLSNEAKIMEYASIQHEIDAENTTYEAARQSITNYNRNELFRFFSSMFGKLSKAKIDTKQHKKTLGGLTPKAEKLQGELASLGINANSENIVAISNGLPLLKKEASIIVGGNLFNKSPEELKTTLDNYHSAKKSEFGAHVIELNQARENADKKISDLSYQELKLVTECAGRDKSSYEKDLGIGYHKDPQFALLMFEMLIRENEVTPEMLLDISKNKEKIQDGRNVVAKTIEEEMRQRLDDIKRKLKIDVEKPTDNDDR